MPVSLAFRLHLLSCVPVPRYEREVVLLSPRGRAAAVDGWAARSISLSFDDVADWKRSGSGVCCDPNPHWAGSCSGMPAAQAQRAGLALFRGRVELSEHLLDVLFRDDFCWPGMGPVRTVLCADADWVVHFDQRERASSNSENSYSFV